MSGRAVILTSLLIHSVLLSGNADGPLHVPEGLRNAVHKVVKAFETENETALTDMIDPVYGMNVVWRRGALNIVTRVSTFSFDDLPGFVPYENIRDNYELTLGILPTIDSYTEEWSVPYGFYCDPGHRSDLVSSAIRLWLDYEEGGGHTEVDYRRMVEMERNSQIIICIWPSPLYETLIFHLYPRNGKWYLSVLDRVTGDFSA